ncbi:outer membrane protein assembly factor BamE [Allohahella marinimesophila]|uniref:Outer membrane protein assembly factor BamE n=1 Tax=Allohahella marinimesophila TaxID=1054972 RepID=A0ABP7Q4J7_9GAMM
MLSNHLSHFISAMTSFVSLASFRRQVATVRGLRRQAIHISVIAVVLGSASGCAFPGVYKIDVQQGTIVEKDATETLAVGMTREQVHYLLGSPLLEPVFTNDYENYVYTIQLSGGKIRKQHIRLEFEGDSLTRIAKLDLLPPELANPGEVYKVRGLREAETLVEEATITQTRGVERRQ